MFLVWGTWLYMPVLDVYYLTDVSVLNVNNYWSINRKPIQYM
jgi:hypothetical protein